MKGMETFYRRMAQSRRCAIRCGGDGGFVPHTKGPVKTDKKNIAFCCGKAAAMTDRLLLFICRQANFFYRKWPSHGGGPVLTVPLLCVAEWTHTLASERAHTTNDYGKRRYT